MHLFQVTTFLFFVSGWPESPSAFGYILEVSLQHQYLYICLYSCIQQMSELKKIKSQELIDRLFNNNIRQNYYQHHHLPARSTTRNFLRNTTPSLKLNVKDSKQKSISKQKDKDKNKQKISKMDIGRELYPEIIKRVQDPGPGTYDWKFQEPKTYRFTVCSSSLGKKRIMKARSKQDRIGPGFYKYDDVANMNLLSQNKKSLVAKIMNSPKKQQRLVYRISEAPGPGRYQNNVNLQKTSNFQQCNSHKISVTARSSIIRKQEYPGGPGFYDWQQFYSKNKQKKKPCIQYKFVYGHPS